MKKILLFVFALMLLSACTPSNQAKGIPNSQPQPAADSQLQDLVSPQTVAEILLNNGFHQTRNYCTGTCTSYEIYTPQTIAKVYDNGTFSIQAVAGNGGVLDMQVFKLVLTQAYGQEFTDWATEKLNASLRKEQTGNVGNYAITMIGKANERVTITISPK